MNLGEPTSCVMSGTVEIAVYDLDDPGLPAAVVAHGVGSTPRFVHEAFARPLAASGYRLVAYDLRGHGSGSPVRDPSDHGLADHAADLAAVADAVGAAAIGGVSLGAHAAARVASESQVEGLVAVIPAWVGRSVPGEGPHAATASAVRAVGVDAVLARSIADPEVAPWLAEVLARDWPTHDPASLAAALVALDGALAPTEAELADVRCPVGVVGWPDDPGHPLDVAERWAGAVPDGRLVTCTMDEVGADREAFGRAAMAALQR